MSFLRRYSAVIGGLILALDIIVLVSVPRNILARQATFIGTFTMHDLCEEQGYISPLDFIDDTCLETYSALFDDQSSKSAATWADGSFDYKAGICGDVAPLPNCDGVVNMGDVVLLLNYVGYPGQYELCCGLSSRPLSTATSEVESTSDSTSPAGGNAARLLMPDNEVYLAPQGSSTHHCTTTHVEIWVDATDLGSGHGQHYCHRMWDAGL